MKKVLRDLGWEVSDNCPLRTAIHVLQDKALKVAVLRNELEKILGIRR